MHKELKLQIPDSLYEELEKQSKEVGVSVEALCLLRLSGQSSHTLVDQSFYSSLSHEQIRKELRRVIESNLPKEEVRKRINTLEFLLSKRYIR